MPAPLPWRILHENLPGIEMLKQNFSSYWVPSENRLKPTEFNEILAWADYCVAVCSGPETFEKSIVAHLSHSCQKDFTFKQINAKVEEFWKRNKRPNDSGHTIVYRIGTKALQGKEFSDERAQSVRKRVRHLLKQPVPEYAEPSSQSTRKKRKVEHISSRNEVPKHLVKQMDGSHLSPSTRNMRRTSPRYSISVQVPRRRSGKTECANVQQNPRAQSVTPKCEHDDISHLSTISPAGDEIEDSQSPTTSRCRGSPEFFLTPPRRMMQLNRTRISASPLVTSAENYPSCSLSECERARQLHSESERDLQTLRGQLEKAKSTIELLQTRLESEEHSRAILVQSAEAPTQKTLSNYLAEIETLRSQILNKAFFVPFTTRDIKKYMPFDDKYFQENMLFIRNEIDDFMCSCWEMSEPCNDIKIQEIPEDLLLLLHRVLGGSWNTLQTISFHSLLRSIISAALCEWVFEVELQESIFNSCPLRDAMLSHLTTMDSEDVARNLDLAAHHTLIEDKSFQEDLISRRAVDLALDLSDIVEPLFNLQTPLDLWREDILKIWQGQQETLKRIFVSALKVKTKAVVSRGVFEVIFPVPGCQYDEAHAEIERHERDGRDLGQTPIVRLCLVPGLRYFSVEKKPMDYNSFRRPLTGSAELGDEVTSPLIIPE